MKLQLLASMALPAVLCCGVATASPVDNGGKVLSGTTDLYLITIGDWSNATRALDLSYSQYLAQNLGTSDWWRVTNQFMRGGTSTLNYGGTLNYTGVTSGNLSQSAIANIVKAEKTANAINDPAAVFMVLFGSGVTAADGLANNYCGEHYFSASATGGNYFGWVDSYSGLNCAYNSGPFAGVQNTASILAHEILETVTDPAGNAWWDSNSASSHYQDETGDMCSWITPSGNQLTQIGSIGMQIQETWDNTAQKCVAGRTANGDIVTAGVNLTTTLPQANPAPEPASWLLCVLGLGLAARSRPGRRA